MRYIKRILMTVLIVAAACSVCASAVLTAKKPKYHYELSSELRLSFSNADSVIEAIRNAMADHDIRIHITYKAADGYLDDVEPLVEELMKYAMAETDKPTEGDYIRYQTGGYELTWGHEKENSDWKYTLVITPKYFADLDQEKEVDESVAKILEEFGFTSETSDYEKVRVIYDYICENVSYDTIHKSSLYTLKNTAYAALKRGIASCQGYCVLFYRLCRESGVSCRVITGMAQKDGEDEFHAWNIVEIGGLYYNVDATWDSGLEDEQYFLRGDKNFTGHVRGEEFNTEEFLALYKISEEDYF